MSLDVPVANDGLYQQPIILTSLFEIPWRKGTIPSMISNIFSNHRQGSKQGGQDTLKFCKTWPAPGTQMTFVLIGRDLSFRVSSTNGLNIGGSKIFEANNVHQISATWHSLKWGGFLCTTTVSSVHCSLVYQTRSAPTSVINGVKSPL